MKATKTALTTIRLSRRLLLVAMLCVSPSLVQAQDAKPYVESIEVSGSPVSNANTVDFIVTFNESVTGVDTSDFVLEASAQLQSVRISKIDGSAATYTISVINVSDYTDGTLSIDLKPDNTGITNASGQEAEGFTEGLYHYVGAAFDISRAVYAGDAESFSIEEQETHSFSLEFAPSGRSMFVMGFHGKDINEYILTEAFDISTASYAGEEESFSVFAQEFNPRSVAFDNYGKKLFVLGSGKDTVFQYSLSAPYDVSTARYLGIEETFSVKKESIFPYSMSFNNDGTKLFTIAMRGGNINEYQLRNPYDISSASYAGDKERFSVILEDRSPVSMKFNPDGTKVYILGIEENAINEYTMEIPFDVSTATYSGELERFSVAAEDGDPRSVTFNNDGTKMFVLGNGKDHVLEYNLDSKALLITRNSLWKILSNNPAELPVMAEQGQSGSIRLSADERNIKFVYETNAINESDQIEYQTIMDGADAYWSAWSATAERQYARLSHGRYTFKVQARNRYGQLSEIKELTFEIQAPWYFTVWAYLLYSTLIILLIWRIVKFNTQRLEREKRELEKVVIERTEEIRQQKDEIASQMQEVATANIMINEQADRLKELDKVKSRFFANISHELRTPLTLINAPLEALIENGSIEDEEVLKTLGVARKNGGSLLSLVEEILDLTKLEAGKLKLIENPVRLSEFVSDTLKAYEAGLQTKSIQLIVDFQPEEDLTMLLDANCAGKILNNLLSNALKFTPEYGTITVSVAYKPDHSDHLQLSVEDNGEGIHENDVTHIFDRFYQSEQPGKKAVGGTGIGLALAKELAQLFEGDLSVRSELGKGSVFTFEFPLKKVSSEVIVPLAKTDLTVLDTALKDTIDKYVVKFEVGKPMLLVVEDHPEMRAFIVQTLQPYFEIRQAENGKMALEILKSERIDITVSDVMMPIMDGFELLAAIKQDESLHEVSLVMLTARAEQEDKLFALTMGIDDYLTKPFNASEFLARIKNILENRIKILRELKGLESNSSATYTANMKALIKAHDLSEREIEIIRLIIKRYSNPEIAEKLYVSRNTVKTHLKNIYSKLDIRSRLEVAEKLSDFAEK